VTGLSPCGTGPGELHGSVFEFPATRGYKIKDAGSEEGSAYKLGLKVRTARPFLWSAVEMAVNPRRGLKQVVPHHGALPILMSKWPLILVGD